MRIELIQVILSLFIQVIASSHYSLKKIQENNESEIMQVVLEEARSSYSDNIIVELNSDSTEDLESNVERIIQWIQNWKVDHGIATNGGG